MCEKERGNDTEGQRIETGCHTGPPLREELCGNFASRKWSVWECFSMRKIAIQNTSLRDFRSIQRHKQVCACVCVCGGTLDILGVKQGQNENSYDSELP